MLRTYHFAVHQITTSEKSKVQFISVYTTKKISEKYTMYFRDYFYIICVKLVKNLFDLYDIFITNLYLIKKIVLSEI